MRRHETVTVALKRLHPNNLQAIMQPNEIHALIQLLDDPDEGVYLHVQGTTVGQRHFCFPALLESRESHAYCDEHERRMDELVDGLHGALRPQRIA